jgi:hypothetical protein
MRTVLAMVGPIGDVKSGSGPPPPHHRCQGALSMPSQPLDPYQGLMIERSIQIFRNPHHGFLVRFPVSTAVAVHTSILLTRSISCTRQPDIHRVVSGYTITPSTRHLQTKRNI